MSVPPMQFRVDTPNHPTTGGRLGFVAALTSQTRVLRMQSPAVVGIGNVLQGERRPATFPGEDRKRVERSYLRFAGVGVQYAMTILVMTLFGIWLDGKLDTEPLFIVAFLLLGFVGATWVLVREVLDTGGKPDEKP